MSSPWANIAKVEAVDLQSIMSEQQEQQQLKQQLLVAQPPLASGQATDDEQPATTTTTTTTTKKSAVDDEPAAEVAEPPPPIDEQWYVVDEDASVAASIEASLNGTQPAAAVDELPAELLLALQSDGAFDTHDNCDSDRLIAEMLQAQLDHDARLRLRRAGDAGVEIAFRTRRRSDDADDQVDHGDPPESRHWDRFETNEKRFDGLSKRGFAVDKDGVRVTKHDATLNGVRNACRVMSFPPEFQTGDAAGFDMQLSNSVFNQLKTYSRRAKKHGGGSTPLAHHKAHDRRENVATAELGLDAQTMLILYKLVNNELLEHVNGIVSTGKEALILHADGNAAFEGEFVVPRECAVKVFKTTLNEFKQRDRYIRDDYRFKERFSKQNNRVVINMWAEKEMHNLMRMRAAGIRCPEVVLLRKNLLVMSFLGENMVASPKLKDVHMTPAAALHAYKQVVETMHTLYGEAKLIHADLSEYNILWHEDNCWFIDVAQAVEPGHPSALEFLMRDCGNVSTFFKRRGVPDVLSREELFRSITGLDPFVHNATMLERIHDKGPGQTLATTNNLDEMPEHQKPRSYPFDYAWDKVREEKLLAEAQAAPASDDDTDVDRAEAEEPAPQQAASIAGVN